VSEPRARDVLGDVRSILLDFDGPICSIFAGLPAPEVAERLRRVLSAAGVPLPAAIAAEADPLEVLRFSANVGTPELVLRVDDELRAAELAAVVVAAPTPGTAEVIKAARRDDRAIAIVSNNSAPAIHAYLDAQGLSTDVAHVVGRRHGLPALMKPSPAPILHALALLGTDATTTVLVGDSTTDVEAAHAAGVRCIGLANRPLKNEILLKAGADAVIANMTDLL
jgi:HAD superfamily hydrolase (TIGR01509 family)